MAQTDNSQPTDPQADGYYGDDDMGSEEIDLSFLDDQGQEDAGKSKKQA